MKIILHFIRWLRLLHGRRLLINRIRISIILVKSAFKSVIFNHQRYFWFCLVLVAVQLVRSILVSLLDPRISLSMLLTQKLTGQNTPILHGSNKLIQLFFLFCEIVVTLHVAAALVYYTIWQQQQKAPSVKAAFLASLRIFKLLSLWSLLELSVLMVTTTLGNFGDIVQFLWQLSTALSIQMIALGHGSIKTVLQRSFNYFRRALSAVISIDIVTDILVFGVSVLVSVLYQNYFFLLFKVPLDNLLIDAGIYYLLAIVFVAETSALTGIYRIIAFSDTSLWR